MQDSRRAFLKRALAVGTSVSAVQIATPSAQTPGIRGFDHVALPMQNVDAMLKFYRALGMDIIEGAQVCSVHFRDADDQLPSSGPVAERDVHAPGAGRQASMRGSLLRLGRLGRGARRPCSRRCPVAIETGPVNRQGGRRATGSSVYVRRPR